MAREPLQATEIVIGKDTNKLSLASDGSLLLQDTLVGPVKLSDLLGGEVVIDPGLLVLVEVADWAAQVANSKGQILYKATVPHNWSLENVADTEGLLPVGVDINVWNDNNELITVNRVWTDANNVYLESTNAINMKVIIKRVN